MLQSEAGYIDARPPPANSTKSSCNARPDHTLGHKHHFDRAPVTSDLPFMNIGLHRPVRVNRVSTWTLFLSIL
jgi:hypothetical protein